MRSFTVIATIVAIVVSLVLIAAVTTIEGAFMVVFGWIPFLGRVLPEVKADGPTVLIGAIALLLFMVGVHWVGWSWRRNGTPRNNRWRFRWTIAMMVGLLLLFTAGISLVGITHQLAWLATSEQPLLGEGLGSRNDSNVKLIGLGFGSYCDTYNSLPPGGTFGPNGEMLHSWETQLLPYMIYSSSGIDKERPWNSPENEKYVKCILPEFINPAFRTPPLKDANGFGLSHYAANSSVLSANNGMKMQDITRGSSNTILIGEVNAGFKPWGHPVNWREPAAGMSGDVNTFGGPAKNNGTLFLMADGSVRFFSNGTNPAVLRALGNPRQPE
jgi:hypothetical protein